MARTTKKKENDQTTPIVTRAAKKDAAKNLIRELLAVKPHKHNELIDAASALYVERFGEGGENMNDVKGRIGSVLDIMKKESDVGYEGGMYALKARLPQPPPEIVVQEPPKTEEKPAPKKRGRKAKTETVVAEETAVVAEESTPAVEPENPAPKKRGRKPKTETPVAEEPASKKTTRAKKTTKKEEVLTVEETPTQTAEPVNEQKEELIQEERLQEVPQAVEEPALPMEEVVAETQQEIQETQEVTQEPQAPQAEEVKEETVKEEASLVVKEKAELKPVMDMSFLFGTPKTKTPEPAKEKPIAVEPAEEKAPEQEPVEKGERKPEPPRVRKEEKVTKQETKKEPKAETKQEPKQETKVSQKPQAKATPAKTEKEAPMSLTNVRKLPARGVKKVTERPRTADEKLCEAFLKRLRSLGGDYFEYYSIYLLERYSMRNGRRLEGLRISGGDNDGGIDGEIELTDKLGFKETIYIQSKNWNPDKGDERLWIVGETLLQQFIGACACRQAKEGKQHCRGIFMTTSRFTPEAKRILETMSDKIVGYDGKDLYEAAKECSFGLIQKPNGEWVLDERILSGNKVFFNLY